MRARRSKIEVASYKGKRFGPALKVILALMLAGALPFAALLGAVSPGPMTTSAANHR